MKNLHNTLLKRVNILVLVIVFFTACDKEFNAIDSRVLVESNLQAKTYTLTPLAYNKKLQNLQVNNLSSNLLGVYKDPVFGTTTASIVAQLIPKNLVSTFGIEPVIDSVILQVPYFSRSLGNDQYRISEQDSLYGKDPIKLSIYQNKYLLRDFDPYATIPQFQKYYSQAEHATDPASDLLMTETSSVNFETQKGALIYENNAFYPSDQVIVTTRNDADGTVVKTKNPPALRLHLDPSFWKTTLIDQSGGRVLQSTSDFKNYLRGLYIKAESVDEQGHMTLLNLRDTGTSLSVYYTSKNSDEAQIATQKVFVMDFSGVIVNPLINDYSASPEPLVDGDQTTGDEKLYLKGAAGSMAVIDIFGTKDADNNKVPDALDDLRDEFLDESGQPTKIINDAFITIIQDETLVTEANHQYDRLYIYDVKNNTSLIDYNLDTTENTANPLDSRTEHLRRRQDVGSIGKGFKIQITEYMKNLIEKDSLNTKLGLTLSNNVNYQTMVDILDSKEPVTKVPAASILTPRGTVLYGSTASNAASRIRLDIFYTETK